MNGPGEAPPPGARDGMKLLQDALEVFTRWKEEGRRESPADLLSRNPHLREFLEPLLGEEPAEEGPGRMGDFEILGEIGRGGMGVVYEARQVSLDRKVALKVLSLGPASNPASLARFRREAQIAASLDHPGLVKILAFGSEGDTFFLAMELVEGASLAEILEEAARKERIPREGREVGELVASLCGLPFREAPAWKGGYVECVLDLVLQVALALDHAHRAGIVHRDVKPSNIIVRPDGRAVLTDFGLARESGDPTMTMTGDFVGTPHYVSPEQARGGRVDGRTDVFSLGSTLYELLTLKKPFAGESTHQVLGRILTKDPAEPHKVAPDLHPDLSAVILKALEKNPALRYYSAGEFARDLRAFLEYRPVSARRPTALSRALKWVKREPRKAVLAFVLGAALFSLGGMGIYLSGKQGEIRLAQAAMKKERLEDLLGMAFLVMEENPAEGKSLLKKAFSLDPKDRDVLLARRLFLEEGEEEPAPAGVRGEPGESPAKKLRSSMDFFLASLEAGKRAGRTMAGRDFREALRAAEESILLSPRPRALYFYNLAALAFKAAEAKKALVAARRASRRAALALENFWPGRIDAKFFLALALSLQDPARALEILDERKAAGAPEPHTAYRIRAFCLASLGRIDRALAVLEEDLARHGRDRKTAASIHLHMGVLSSAKGDPSAALDHYRKAVSSDPELFQAWNNLGLVLVKKRKWEEAEQCLKKASAARPGYVSPHMNLGLLAIQMRKPGEAERHLEKAMELDPQNYTIRSSLAWVLRKTGRRKQSEELYRSLIRLDPGRGEAFEGMGLLRREDPLEALPWFSEAAERDPENWRFRLNLGTTLARLGRFEEALPHIRKAVSLRPDHRISHQNLVRIFKDLGRTAEARAEILRWMEKDRDSLWDWFTLAEIHAGARAGIPGAPPGEDIRSAEKTAALTGEGDPEALLFLAEIQLRHGRRDRAWKSITKSRRLLETIRMAPSKKKRVREGLGRVERAWKGGTPHGPGPGGKEGARGGSQQGTGVRRGAGPGK